jgi:hypothetical protein
MRFSTKPNNKAVVSGMIPCLDSHLGLIWPRSQIIIPDTTALLLGLVENRICAVLSPIRWFWFSEWFDYNRRLCFRGNHSLNQNQRIGESTAQMRFSTKPNPWSRLLQNVLAHVRSGYLGPRPYESQVAVQTGNHPGPVPDTPSGHGPGHFEEDDSRDEPNPSSDIGSGASRHSFFGTLTGSAIMHNEFPAIGALL